MNKLNILLATAPHLELGIWETSDPKQQRRAHRGCRGCEPAIVHNSTMCQPRSTHPPDAQIQRDSKTEKTRQEYCYLSKSSKTTVSGTISLKPATASSSVTTSAPKQSESGIRKATRQKKPQDEWAKSSTADRGRGCVASGGPRGQRRHPEAGSRRLCRPRSQPDHLKQRPRRQEQVK